MIRLTSAAQARSLAHCLPVVAVERMLAFEGSDGKYDPEAHGSIVVLEPGDHLEQVLHEAATEAMREGLSPFEYVFSSQDRGGRVFEAVVPLAGDAVLVLIVPDQPWIDPLLRGALESEVVEE